MSENRSGLFKAMLALSMMLFVIAFVVFKSGAIENRITTKVVDGKTQESRSYGFNASKIPAYLKSVVAPITGKQALLEDNK
ncbi:MAG: hypothetical protein KKB51_01710 [Candidatus Riflebacteria bacterium]|nr:hypothetical protein [Candidatus Riflebacteria bacterium]